MTEHKWSRWLTPALLPLSVACGSAEADEPAGGTFTSVSGACSGTFIFEPATPVVGKNQLDAEIHGSTGTPIEGASLEVGLWMPAHGHGSSATPAVAELGGGHYQVDNLVFEMPGTWEITIDVEAGAIEDRFVFPVAVR